VPVNVFRDLDLMEARVTSPPITPLPVYINV